LRCREVCQRATLALLLTLPLRLHSINSALLHIYHLISNTLSL